MLAILGKFKVYLIIGSIVLAWGYYTKSLIEDRALLKTEIKGWQTSLKVWQKEAELYRKLNELANEQRIKREEKLKKVEDNLNKLRTDYAKVYNRKLHPAVIKFMRENFTSKRNKKKASSRVYKNSKKSRLGWKRKNNGRYSKLRKRSKHRSRQRKRQYAYLL